MLSDILKWGARRPDRSGGADSAAAARDEPVVVSKGLPKFLAALTQQPSPVLLDFGPVIGTNVEHFGERLGCKLFIEDLLADIDRHTRAATLDQLPAAFEKRFRHGDATVDGILCWDLFDFLDKPAAQAVGRELARILRPGGALMAFFAATRREGEPHYTRFVVKDEQTLVHRPYAATRPTQPPLTNRDIALLFPGLNVSDSFLLLSHIREVLLRK